jgi:hypothetical protein
VRDQPGGVKPWRKQNSDGWWGREFADCSVDLVQPAGIQGGRGGGDRLIRKLKSGQYRLYSRKKNPKSGRRRNLGTFRTRKAAEAHERAVQYFKRQ